MKVKRYVENFILVCVLVVFTVTIGNTSVIMAKGLDKDNYGIAKVWIVDNKNLNFVNERYSLTFFPHDSKDLDLVPYYLKAETVTGSLSIKLPPGIYYIYFHSLSKIPKYSIEPHPFSKYGKEGNRFTIEIHKGKITKVLKKVEEGGSLRVMFVDPNGNVLPFNKPNCDLTLSLNSEIFRNSVYCNSLTTDNPLEGELTIRNILFPAEYSLNINSSDCGIGSIIRNDINIEKGKLTEIKITIDFNDQTGMLGYVFDQSNKPIEGAEISLISGNFEGHITTDLNGSYKIVGLHEGTYHVSVSIKKGRGVLVEKFGRIYIKKNYLTNKNLVMSIE